MTRTPRKLLSIAHSYVVALNRRLAREFAREGNGRWELTAVAPTRFLNSNDRRLIDFQPLANEGFALETVDVRLPSSVHLFTYKSRLKEICARNWDLVYAWEEPYVAAGWQVSRAVPARVPFAFWTSQNLDKRYPPPFGYFERATVARSSGWLACGQSVVETLLRRPHYGDRPHQLAPYGVDADCFAPDPQQRAATLKKLNWSELGPPVIGCLGRFVPEKGLRVLMSAADALKSDWRILLVGAGPMQAELESWAARHGDRVRICTNVDHDDVPMYLNAMDILAAPSLTLKSWREQFGRMITEAMSCGVAVVGSNSGEIPHVIGDAGIVVPEGNVAAWTAALGQLIESPERRRELALAGRERVHERFSWPVVARQTLAFFDRLLEEQGKPS